MNDPQDSAPTSPSLVRRRRTFLAPLWLLAMAGVFLIAMAFAYWNSATTTTIVLVRHAEKQVGAISDAPLSPQGEVRASRLAQMFGDSEPFGRIDRIYVTNTRRTQQTAAGLGQRLGLNVLELLRVEEDLHTGVHEEKPRRTSSLGSTPRPGPTGSRATRPSISSCAASEASSS